MVFGVAQKFSSASLFLTILPSSVLPRRAFTFSSSIAATIFTAISSTLLRSRVRNNPPILPSCVSKIMITMTIIISTSVNHAVLVLFPFVKSVFGVVFQYIYSKIIFMYRVYILLFLAIVSSVFAVDSSQSILQAKKIADTSMTVSWMPIPEATQYKIFYDESALLEPTNPRLLLDTDFITTTEGELTQISPATEYTIKVHGYNAE